MKSGKVLLLGAIMAAVLSGCGEQVKNDETFMTNLAKGLEARWKIADTTNDTAYTDAEERDYLEQVCQAELEAIGDIDEYEFEDADLKELAKDYVENLNVQKEATSSYGKDDEQFVEQFSKIGYAGRAKDIYLIHNDYTITVDEDYDDDLSDICSLGKDVIEEDEKLKALDSVLSNDLTLEFNGDVNVLLLENVTDFDYENIEFDITLYDKDDAEVYNEPYYVEKFEAGSKNKHEVYYYGSDLDHATISAKYNRDYVDILGEEVSTEKFDIEVANEYSLEIELSTKTPCEVNYYGFDGIQESTAEITDFSYETESWMDGEASVEFAFSGTETYENPEGYSNGYFQFNWNLYDEDGNKVQGETVFISNLNNGDDFQNEKSWAYDLKPGKYTLELTDYKE